MNEKSYRPKTADRRPRILLTILLACSLWSSVSCHSSAQEEYRTWTTSSGRKSDVKLSVVEQNRTTVKLKREDNGKVITFRIDRLSRTDQAYLRNLRNTSSSPSAQRPAPSSSTWSQFRGPNAQGRIPAGDYPTEWSEAKNIKWKIEPGPGASSPIVWGNRLFFTTYSGYGLSKESPGDPKRLVLHLICLDTNTGRTVWKKDIPHRGDVRPFEGAMEHMGYAAHTPVTDGERVYCHFGNHGVVVFDMNGNPVWDDGPYAFVESNYGSGASPVLFKNLLLVNTSMEDKTLRAFDSQSGREVWKMENNDASYTTPTLIRDGDDPLMVISGSRYAKAFNPRIGEERWRFKHGRGGYVIPVPAFDGGDAVYTLSPNGSQPPLAAIPINSRGEVLNPKWDSKARGTIGSPLLVNGYIYSYDWALTCHRASDGELIYEGRVEHEGKKAIGGSGVASSIAIGDLVYITSKDGSTAILKAGPRHECVAVNMLREQEKSMVRATIAAAGGRLYLRSDQFLYCIAKE